MKKILLFCACLPFLLSGAEVKWKSEQHYFVSFTGKGQRVKLEFINHGTFEGPLREMIRITDLSGNGAAPETGSFNCSFFTRRKHEIHVPGEGAWIIRYSIRCGDEILFTSKIILLNTLPVERVNQELSPVGMYCHLLYQNGEQELALLKKLGLSHIRANLLWSQQEPQKGKFNWKTGDSSYAPVKKYGMSAMWNIVYPPRWAAPVPNMYGGVPELSAHERFAYEAAKRYPLVGFWSVWNEPDAASHWDGGGKTYAIHLKALHKAIKKANPQAKILPGGVTGNPVLAERFMRELHAENGGSWFDIYDYHYDLAPLHIRLKKEFNWNHPLWNTELSSATCHDLVRSTISDLSKGVVRSYWFLFTTGSADTEEFRHHVMVDKRLIPTRNLVSLAAALRMLNGFTGRIENHSGRGFEAYKLMRKGKAPLWAVWSRSGDPVRVFTPCPLAMTDLFGRKEILSPEEGSLSIPGRRVSYLETKEDLRFSTDFSARLLPCAAMLFGCEGKVSAQIVNRGKKVFRGKVRITSSPDWKKSSDEKMIVLKPGEKECIKFSLIPRTEKDEADSLLSLTLENESGKIIAADYRETTLSLPISFSLKPVFRYGKPRICAELRNTSGSPVSGEILFETENMKSLKLPFTVPAGKVFPVYGKIPENRFSAKLSCTVTIPGWRGTEHAALLWNAVPYRADGSLNAELPEKAPVILEKADDFIPMSHILNQWKGPGDQSIRAQICWNEKAVWLLADVTDDFEYAGGAPALRYERDSLQVWFGGKLYTLGRDGKGGADLFPADKNVLYRTERKGNVTKYRIGFLPPDGKSWHENDVSTFAFIVNDSDTQKVREGYMVYKTDIGDPQKRRESPEITLVH